jgi:hypothetical protein
MFVPVLFMWNVVVLLLMHLLGAADCVRRGFLCVCNRIDRKYHDFRLHRYSLIEIQLHACKTHISNKSIYRYKMTVQV